MVSRGPEGAETGQKVMVQSDVLAMLAISSGWGKARSVAHLELSEVQWVLSMKTRVLIATMLITDLWDLYLAQ